MMASTFDPSERLKYDASEIHAYLDTISLPPKHRQSPVFVDSLLARTVTHGLPLLAALQKYQLAAIPFENLTLHYNPVPGVSIQPSAVHQKFVTSACGRGGRCQENNLLFYTVLLSLGYNVTSIAGRVNEAIQPAAANPSWPGPRYDGWNHRITLVHFNDESSGNKTVGEDVRTFLVDTGFGATGPTQPMELVKDSSTCLLNVPPNQESRIRWTPIPDVVDKKQKAWVYEIRKQADSEWTPAYCFTELEFLPSDYAMMSYFTSNNKKSWFTFSIVCVKMVLGRATRAEGIGENESSDEELIVGDVSLFNNEVKRRIYGKSEVLERLELEEQRVQALEKWFGIKLTESEINGIKGTVTALV